MTHPDSKALTAFVRFGILALLAALLAACAGKTEPSALQLRELQTRRYEGVSRAAVLHAAISAFDNMGFSVNADQIHEGVLKASIRRNFYMKPPFGIFTTVQIISYITTGGFSPIAHDRVEATLVCTEARAEAQPAKDRQAGATALPDTEKNNAENTIVEARLQLRFLYMNGAEKEPENAAYGVFFDRLSQAVYLEKEGL